MSLHTKNRLLIDGLVMAVALALPAVAIAQGTAFPTDDTYRTIANVATTAASFLNTLTWFVFTLLNFLLDPTFIFDTSTGLMGMLNVIWQLSRDLMNIAFAVGLVGAAIYTVVTANKEFVAAHLKTFVMAVVLVNFSWFIPQVVLDIANVTASAIFTIPTALVNTAPEAACRYTSSSNVNCLEEQALPKGNFSCACKAIADFEAFPNPTFVKTNDDINGWECHTIYCARYVPLNAATVADHSAILNGLIINHARLPQLALVTRVEGDGKISDLLIFVLKELMVVVIHIALFFPLLALLVALVIRIPILWLTMAFMPFYFLSWVVPEQLSFVKEYTEKIKDWFLRAAFLPTAIAIPLSIGYIMANAGSRIEFDRLSGINFNLIDGIGNFYQLLWLVMVLGVLWTGTFMVLEAMTANMPGGSLIGQIKNTGQEAGKFAAELPLAAPIIPGPGNLLNLKDALNPRALRGALRSGGYQGVAGLLGGQPDAKEKAQMDKAVTTLKSEDTIRNNLTVNLQNYAGRAGPSDDPEQLIKHLKKELGVESNAANLASKLQQIKDALSRAGKLDRAAENSFDAAIKRINKHNGIGTGGTAPTPPPGGAPGAAPGGGGGGAPPPAPAP